VDGGHAADQLAQRVGHFQWRLVCQFLYRSHREHLFQSYDAGESRSRKFQPTLVKKDV
jgi:hypothetical protein